MPASIKIKGCRCNREAGASGKRVKLPRQESCDLESYHSHHRLIGDNPVTQLPNKENKNLPPDSSLTLCADPFLSSKAVVFSSKIRCGSQSQRTSQEIPRKQSSASRNKTQNEETKCEPKRKTPCLSKLVQTSSSISKTVSCRSIAVGVSSNTDLHPREKYQSKHISRSMWPSSSPTTRRAHPLGSCMTISSARYSRTESSMMATLEVPPASYRHARCMANHNYFSPSKKSSPAVKRTNNKPNASPAKETIKPKLVPQRKTKIS